MKKLIFGLAIAALFLSAQPARAARMRLTTPEPGETWTIGQPHLVTWHIDGAIPAGAYLQFNLLDGLTTIRAGSLATNQNDGLYALTPPLTGCWYGVCQYVFPGSYLVEAVLYSGGKPLARATAGGLINIVYP